MTSAILSTDTEERLKGILREYLPLVADDEEIAVEADLTDLGLDSMNAVNLMLDIEEEFEVSFPESMLNAEVFYSVSTLAKAIQSLIDAK
ncbi:MAG: acyl carrier protein [Moorea sp. SIO4G2]|nr:acyl carrier protein [Moorena sp. SIO4G2]